jgi:hypothetical protein
VIAIQRIPVARLNFLDRGPMLGRVRLGQMQDQQQLSAPDNLLQNGAILQVSVSVPSAYAQGGGGGQSQTLTAMIDSGASISCITIDKAQAIGLPQVSQTQLGGVGGMTMAPVYGAALNLTQFGVNVDPVQIAGVANPLPNVDMLIGRDLLAKNLNFSYHGGQGAFTLTTDTGAPVAGVTPAPGQPIPTQPMQGMPAPAAQAAPPPPPAAPGSLPQPPAGGGTVLGMSPVVAIGVGTGILAVGAGALHLFKVI